MPQHRGWLTNRHIIIERNFKRARHQRFQSWWDNPYGTQSHERYHTFFITALFGAICRKIQAEFFEWQNNRPTRAVRIP